VIELLEVWFREHGLFGVLAVMFLEGISLPIPGVAVVFAYGYLFPFSYWHTAIVAAGMSVVYSIASLIPYFLGAKLEKLFKNRGKKGLQKAKDVFIRYGSWSVALTRPFTVGNYISYVAGISKMKLPSFLLLTFIGIYPWCYGMLVLGYYFNGSYQAFYSYFQNHSLTFYLTIGITSAVIFLYFYKKYKRTQTRTIAREGGDHSV
jgi:membrane protein DedA with SNARE-associated domain